jgi:hypothetical protein
MSAPFEEDAFVVLRQNHGAAEHAVVVTLTDLLGVEIHAALAASSYACIVMGGQRRSCWKYALEPTGFDPLVGSDGFDPLWCKRPNGPQML